MNFDEVIKLRRSTREFLTKEVKKEDIYSLIECARWAPSAGNRQPWLFVILENNKKNKIADIMEEHLKNIDVSLDGIENATHAYTPTTSVKKSISVIREVPILILVFRKRSEDWKDGDYLSIGCAVEHMCLKATDLGLGSLWLRDVIYTRDKIAKSLGYENLELVTGLAIGYSNAYPYERHKKKIEEIMEWNA